VGWNPTWFTPSIFLNYPKGPKMPKIKTNRAAAKRFKKTGTGKFVFSKSHASHILTKKTRKRKRVLRQSQIIDKTNRKALKLLLPNG
jgi:large subunit ribosomal protein L35